MRYPEWMRQHTRRRRKQGDTLKAIANDLGVHQRTIRRWLHPESAKAEDLAAKRRRMDATKNKACVDCGKRVWRATRCRACNDRKIAREKKWTRESVVAAIKQWAAEHDGEPPSSSDWVPRVQGDRPSLSSVYGPYGPFKSWNEAIAAAGFKPRPAGGPPSRTFDKQKALALRKQGLTNPEVAEQLGVSYEVVWYHIGGLTPEERKRAFARRRQELGRPPKPRTREERITALQKALRKEKQQ